MRMRLATARVETGTDKERFPGSVGLVYFCGLALRREGAPCQIL